MVNLYWLAPTGVLARMVAGDRVHLKIDGCRLIVENSRGEYLGQVELKHGQRLIKLMEGGNKYSAAVISSAEDKMIIIIREVYQDPSQTGQLSFPPKVVEEIRSYVGDRLIRSRLEYEEGLVEEPGYTIIDKDGLELLSEELPGINDTDDNGEQED